jgi:hypothetical protein
MVGCKALKYGSLDELLRVSSFFPYIICTVDGSLTVGAPDTVTSR